MSIISVADSAGESVQRRKIDISNYGLINEYSPPLGRWGFLAYWLPALLVLYAMWTVYSSMQIRFNVDYNPMLDPRFGPYYLTAGVALLLVVSLLMEPGYVKTFQEGIYVFPGPGIPRDTARLPTFFPWKELSAIILSPYRTMGMSLVGSEPYHEVVLPDSIKSLFDEIQHEILQMQPRGKVKIIDLGDITHYPLAEFGSFFHDLFGFAYVLALLIAFGRLFLKDIGLVISYLSPGAAGSHPLFLLIPVISGLALAGAITAIVIIFRRGFFANRLIIYKEGILRIAQGVAAFTRWEELDSIEKLRPGMYRVNAIDERVRPHNMSVGKSRDDEFERILKRLGKLAG
jgi:hypothetical protein